MPLGDRTGPSGMGPGTGRAAGYCYGYNAPGYGMGGGRGMGRRGGSKFGFGRGMRMGMGMGRPFTGQPFTPGYGYGMPAMSREEEIRILRAQLDQMGAARKEIEKRIEEIGKD